MIHAPGEDILASDADCLINPVNCRGVMGAGLAKAMAERFPGILAPYKRACETGALKPGLVQMIRVDRASGQASKDGDLWICNLPTKDDWRAPSRLEWIETALAKLPDAFEKRGIRSVAVPMLGAGLGGLDWAEVHPVVERHLGGLDGRGIAVRVLGEKVERAPADFAFFWRAEDKWSQWHPRGFDAHGASFRTAEHYMMWRKAQLFGDTAAAGDILAAELPAEAKRLGRAVKGFRDDVWEKERFGIVVDATRYKAWSHPDLMADLLALQGKTVAEASPFDKVWGIGLDADHPDARNPERWTGLNLLGRAVMQVRDEAVMLRAVARDARDRPVPEFGGHDRVFSNMTKMPVAWGDDVTPLRVWPCNELPYVLGKTREPGVRQALVEAHDSAGTDDPEAGGKKVKTAGARIAVRPDWDQMKLGHMRLLVEDKIRRNPTFAATVLATGSGAIVEGNYWGDTFWGVATRDVPKKGVKAGEGANNLGRLIMAERDRMRTALGLERTIEQTRAASPALAANVPRFEVVNVHHVKTDGRLPADVVDMSRHGTLAFTDGTKLGNPFPMAAESDREAVVRRFAQRFLEDLKKPGFPEWVAKVSEGKRGACYCAPKLCHVHVIKAAVEAVRAGADPKAAVSAFVEDPTAARAAQQAGEPARPAAPPAARGDDDFGFGYTAPKAAAAAPVATGGPPDGLGPMTPENAYAGIGSRETPPDVLAKMETIAARLAQAGMTLRSGAAPGADTAFENGAKTVAGSRREIFLPWAGFQKHPDGIHQIPKAAFALAERMHPNWSLCSEAARKLHARNSCQILGRDLKSPVKVVVCWTEGGKMKGGTSQALRIAQEAGIPIINLGNPAWRVESVDAIVAAALAGRDRPLGGHAPVAASAARVTAPKMTAVADDLDAAI